MDINYEAENKLLATVLRKFENPQKTLDLIREKDRGIRYLEKKIGKLEEEHNKVLGKNFELKTKLSKRGSWYNSP